VLCIHATGIRYLSVQLGNSSKLITTDSWNEYESSGHLRVLFKKKKEKKKKSSGMSESRTEVICI
jgi:hypothetical protein